MEPHWTQKVAAHPVVSKISLAFGDSVDHVSIGIDSCKITFKLGQRYDVYPREGMSLIHRLLCALPDHDFTLTFGAEGNSSGVIPSLYAIVEWRSLPISG